MASYSLIFLLFSDFLSSDNSFKISSLLSMNSLFSSIDFFILSYFLDSFFKVFISSCSFPISASFPCNFSSNKLVATFTYWFCGSEGWGTDFGFPVSPVSPDSPVSPVISEFNKVIFLGFLVTPTSIKLIVSIPNESPLSLNKTSTLGDRPLPFMSNSSGMSMNSFPLSSSNTILFPIPT